MVDIRATGSWAITGVGVLVGEDPYTPPEPPVLEPGGSVVPPVAPPPQSPPSKVKTEPLRRLSERMPQPVLDSSGNPVNWSPSSVVSEPVGTIQIVVEGVDITYLMDVETPFPTWSRVEPFGSDQAQISLPQITGFHRVGSGNLSWCKEGANVDIFRVNASGGRTSRFAGVVVGAGHHEESGVYTLDCLGVMFVGDLQLKTPPFITKPLDAGTFIPQVLNNVIGRRFGWMDTVRTRAMTSVLGGWEPRLTGVVASILATTVTNGRQWTIDCPVRNPVMKRKDTSTIGWTVSNGQRGIDVNLTKDLTQATNVIYGEGITPDGGRWRNAKYPNWRPDDSPAYPGLLSQGMGVGYRDSQTTSGNGVSVWQARAGQSVTGVLSQSDRLAWRQIQANAGIHVDNYLGPQTWAATFQVGSNTGTLDGAWIMPIAYSKQVEPYLYDADGGRIGPDPSFDPNQSRVERYINFGAGVTRREGTTAAKEIHARDSKPGWVGTVTMTADPEQGSKFDVVSEGTNGRIRYFRGESLDVHVARVDYSEDTVTATVDTNARDYPTLDAILDREREAVDPARSYRKQATAALLASDRATWDAEAPGGRVPRLALFGGLWTVVRIPVAQYGTIVRTSFTTSGGASPFAVGVFDRPINAAQLLTVMGNPLVAENNPWQAKSDQLDKRGLLMAWGWKEQPAGYYPHEYANPDGKEKFPVTGRLFDDASWDYASRNPPWLWVAMIARSSCWVEGRFWHGTDQ